MRSPDAEDNRETSGMLIAVMHILRVQLRMLRAE